MFSNFFKNRPVYEIMYKNIVQPNRPQMALWRIAHCMLGTRGYNHTLRICNNYFYSATTMVARTRLNVT
jgi:hypothetical protein